MVRGYGPNIYFTKSGGGTGDTASRTPTQLGELMLVDDERGTLACYQYACCGGGKLTKYPCVTCRRIAEPLPCHPPPAMSPEMLERYGLSK